jgi:hypothetical protein
MLVLIAIIVQRFVEATEGRIIIDGVRIHFLTGNYQTLMKLLLRLTYLNWDLPTFARV